MDISFSIHKQANQFKSFILKIFFLTNGQIEKWEKCDGVLMLTKCFANLQVCQTNTLVFFLQKLKLKTI